jgi:DNA-binding GntR family transcriptional regulator
MPTLSPVSTVDALADALRHQVLDGSLAPGTYLREVQVATSYGVARHTVRAAMQMLVLEGVLRHTPNRGVHVPSWTPTTWSTSSGCARRSSRRRSG